MEEKSRKWGLLVILVIIVLVAIAGLYFLFGGKNKLVSPVPEEPSFKVTYFTPTPGPITPSSTPSATPKVKAAPTKPAPTKADLSPTVTPKVTASPSATPKP